VNNICRTTIVQQAWEAGQELTVHGWIYGIENGLLKDLGVSIRKYDDMEGAYRKAIAGNDFCPPQSGGLPG